MGFPIRPSDVAAAGLSCMFSHTPEDLECRNLMRSRRTAVGQAGNAMHVGAIGSILASLLLLAPQLGELGEHVMDSSFGAALLQAAKRRRQ